MSQIKKVLFVCRGNAARSQMAEAFYNWLTGSHSARSAGTEVSVEKAIPDEVVQVMGEIKIDVATAHRKFIDEKAIKDAEIILLMTDKSVPAQLIGNPKVVQWDVDDPRGMDIKTFRRVRDEIKTRVQQLLTH